MSISLFSEILNHFPASRAKALHARFGIECVYALVWPDYEAPVHNHPKANREQFEAWRQEAGVPLWAWFNCRADQAADAAEITRLDDERDPDGWLLDIEGTWTKGADLREVIAAAAKTGKPVRASLAGASAGHVDLDFRTLERYGVAVDWQAYMDSGEGPPPAVAVSELYAASFIIPGWTYRARLGSTYGWGKVTRTENGQRGVFDSFKRPGVTDATFAVSTREWGWNVAGRELVRDGKSVGLLMGRAPYSNIRVTLDVSRSAQARTPDEWVSIAASARVPGNRKRACSVYLAEIASDDVLAAIAKGAAL